VVLHVKTDAVVGHTHANAFGQRLGGDVQSRRLGSAAVFDGVVDQIGQHLVQATLPGQQHQRRQLHAHLNAQLGQRVAAVAQYALHEIGQIHLGERRCLGLQARVGQQVFDQAVEILRGGNNLADAKLRTLTQAFFMAALELLRVTGDAAQRRFQVV